jgi:hypothetical protein
VAVVNGEPSHFLPELKINNAGEKIPGPVSVNASATPLGVPGNTFPKLQIRSQKQRDHTHLQPRNMPTKRRVLQPNAPGEWPIRLAIRLTM